MLIATQELGVCLQKKAINNIQGNNIQYFNCLVFTAKIKEKNPITENIDACWSANGVPTVG